MPSRRASGPTLSQRALNRALLARQGLLDRFPTTVPETLDRIGGIQAQYAPSMYVGLWSRTDLPARETLTERLERRDVVQGTLLRSTIHLVSRADYWPTVVAIRCTRREWHLRVTKNDPPEAAWLQAADRLRAALQGGPMRRRDIDALIGSRFRSGISLWLDLLRVPPSGTWERRPADLFGLASAELGPESGTEAEGVRHLVQRYLQGFGPARPADIADWAGLPVALVEAALDSLAVTDYADESGRRLVDLPDLSLPDPSTPAPVRFLPTWDATLLVHARRTQILPEEHRDKVFHIKNPQSVRTFLVDGAVAGAWRYQDGRIELEPYAPLSRSVRRELGTEAERLAVFHS